MQRDINIRANEGRESVSTEYKQLSPLGDRFVTRFVRVRWSGVYVYAMMSWENRMTITEAQWQWHCTTHYSVLSLFMLLFMLMRYYILQWQWHFLYTYHSSILVNHYSALTTELLVLYSVCKCIVSSTCIFCVPTFLSYTHTVLEVR